MSWVLVVTGLPLMLVAAAAALHLELLTLCREKFYLHSLLAQLVQTPLLEIY
jgi:hypothetical protein